MKNLILLITISLFISFTLHAQKSSCIGVEGAVTASESYIFATDQGSTQALRIVNNVIEHKVNWNFAITYEVELREHVWFKTGIETASQGFAIRNVMLTDDNGNVVGIVHHRNNTIYLGIPLSLRAEIPISKIGPYIEVGVAPSIAAIDNSLTTDFTNFQPLKRFEPLFDRFALATNIAIGSNYVLSEKHIFYAQVHSQVMLLDFYREGQLNGVFYSVGLRAGVRMAI